MSFDSATRAQAAATMSSTRNSFTRQADGTVDTETPWLTARERVARTVMTNPDVVFYLLYLCSNKARTATLDIAATLESLITSAEGTLYAQQAVPATAATAMVSATSSMTTLVASGTAPSMEALARVAAETKAYAASSLIPNAKSGTRLQVKGAEAGTGYTTAKAALQKNWDGLLRLLKQCTVTSLFAVDTVRTEALRTPTANLATAAAVPSDGSNASSQLLQLLAGASALAVIGREVNPLLRFSVDGSVSFPSGVSIVEGSSSGGVVSTFSFLKDGVSLDPRLLSIAVGDSVTWGVNTAQVSAVSSTMVSISASTVPTGATGNVEILPFAVAQYRVMRDALKAVLAQLPTAAALTSKLQTLEGTSAGEVRDRCSYLAGLAALLNNLSTTTLSVLERLGASEPTVTATAADTLLAFAPPFTESIKKDGRALLDSLKFGGYDRAETTLIEADVTGVILMTSEDATYLKRILKLSAPLAPTTAGK